MVKQKVAIISYIIFSLVAIVVLVVLLSRKKCNSEGFKKCICSDGQGGREQDCQDTVTVNNLYVTNKLSEFSKFPNKGWSKVSPGDIEFPKSQGCASSPPEKTWVKWDFTDFGS